MYNSTRTMWLELFRSSVALCWWFGGRKPGARSPLWAYSYRADMLCNVCEKSIAYYTVAAKWTQFFKISSTRYWKSLHWNWCAVQIVNLQHANLCCGYAADLFHIFLFNISGEVKINLQLLQILLQKCCRFSFFILHIFVFKIHSDKNCTIWCRFSCVKAP